MCEVQATRVAPWSMMKMAAALRQQQPGYEHGVEEEHHDPLPLKQQEKMMALQADMDSANRELMAIDPYYTHW